MLACRRYDLPRGIADAHYLYARVERSLGHPEAAARHLDEGIVPLPTKLGNPDLLASYLRGIRLDPRGARRLPRRRSTSCGSGRRKPKKSAGNAAGSSWPNWEARYENRSAWQADQTPATRRRTAAIHAGPPESSKLSRTLARSYAVGEVVVFGAIGCGDDHRAAAGTRQTRSPDCWRKSARPRPPSRKPPRRNRASSTSPPTT